MSARLFVFGAVCFALGCTRQAAPSRAPLVLYADPPALGQPPLAENPPAIAPSTAAEPAGAAAELSRADASQTGEHSSSQGAISSPLGAEPVVPPHLLGGTSSDRPPASRPFDPAPARVSNAANLGRSFPSGDACRTRLSELGIAYDRIDEKRGIETPIVLKGPIGGIRYTLMGTPIVCDCRLALALSTVAPKLRALGVNEFRLAGAYSYRMARVGRLSLHAFGLAFDVHEIVVHGVVLSVTRDYARGLRNGCAETSPALNRIACTLESTAVFRELLTPDYDADHQDHVHLAIAPIGHPGLIAKRPPPRAPSPAPIAARAEPKANRAETEPSAKPDATEPTAKGDRSEPTAKRDTREPTAKRKSAEPTAKLPAELIAKRPPKPATKHRPESPAKRTPAKPNPNPKPEETVAELGFEPIDDPLAEADERAVAKPLAKRAPSKRAAKRPATPAGAKPPAGDAKQADPSEERTASADAPPAKAASPKAKSAKARPERTKTAKLRQGTDVEPAKELSDAPRTGPAGKRHSTKERAKSSELEELSRAALSEAKLNPRAKKTARPRRPLVPGS